MMIVIATTATILSQRLLIGMMTKTMSMTISMTMSITVITKCIPKITPSKTVSTSLTTNHMLQTPPYTPLIILISIQSSKHHVCHLVPTQSANHPFTVKSILSKMIQTTTSMAKMQQRGKKIHYDKRKQQVYDVWKKKQIVKDKEEGYDFYQSSNKGKKE